MEICPKCGAERPQDAMECPQCGIIYARYEAAQAKKREEEAEAARRAQIAAMQEAEDRKAEPPPEKPKRRGMVFCPACKKQVSGNAEACPNCGEPIRDNPNLVSAETSLGFKIAMFGVLCLAGWLIHTLWSAERDFPSAKHEAGRSNTIAITERTPGCRTVEEFRKLADIAASKDDAAFGKALVNSIAAGRCTLLEPGAQVYREDSSLRHGAVKVRVAGETESWWINMK